MLLLWVVVAALAYLLLLGVVLLFFASVGKANERWARAFRAAHSQATRGRDHIHAA